MKTYGLVLFLELGLVKWSIIVYMFIITETLASHSIVTPIILKFYLNETIKSVATRNAKNYDPKFDPSTEFWLSEY